MKRCFFSKWQKKQVHYRHLVGWSVFVTFKLRQMLVCHLAQDRKQSQSNWFIFKIKEKSFVIVLTSYYLQALFRSVRNTITKH